MEKKEKKAKLEKKKGNQFWKKKKQKKERESWKKKGKSTVDYCCNPQ